MRHIYLKDLWKWLNVLFVFLILQRLLLRGQERDEFVFEMRQKEEPDHVLELRQTIQIMQEKLEEREGEAFMVLTPLHWGFTSENTCWSHI